MDEGNSINSLFYADDLVLFAESSIKMKKCLSVLESYCAENSMLVNKKKSKMMVFRNGGKLNRHCIFTFHNEEIEISSSFKYLGVVFTPSGGFRKAAEASVVNSNFAACGVRSLISKSGTVSLETWSTLFRSMVESTLLYGSEVWGLMQGDILERVQVKFVKSLYYLHSSTPGYALRLEFGLKKLILCVFSRALRWLNKVLLMDENRFPRICLSRQMKTFASVPTLFSWLGQLRSWFERGGFAGLWEVLLRGNFTQDVHDKAILGLSDWLLEQDTVLARRSTYCIMYREIVDLNMGVFTELSHSLNRARIYYQLLFHNQRFQTLYSGGQSNHFYCEEICSLCNTKEKDTILHFIFGCPVIAGYRPACFQDLSGSHLQRLAGLLRSGDASTVDGLLGFMGDALRFRRFVRDCMLR